MASSPISIGVAVPMARVSRRADTSPGKMVFESREKKKAESPKPDITRAVVVAR